MTAKVKFWTKLVQLPPFHVGHVWSSIESIFDSSVSLTVLADQNVFLEVPMDQHQATPSGNTICAILKGFHTEGPRPRLKSAANGSRQVVT